LYLTQEVPMEHRKFAANWVQKFMKLIGLDSGHKKTVHCKKPLASGYYHSTQMSSSAPN